MTDIAREWADRAGKAQEAVNELGAGPPGRLTDSDRRTVARARELTEVLHGGVDAWCEYAGETDPVSAMTDLLGKALVRLEGMVDLADRLGGHG
jgi:hypothetical protein